MSCKCNKPKGFGQLDVLLDPTLKEEISKVYGSLVLSKLKKYLSDVTIEKTLSIFDILDSHSWSYITDRQEFTQLLVPYEDIISWKNNLDEDNPLSLSSYENLTGKELYDNILLRRQYILDNCPYFIPVKREEKINDVLNDDED